MTKVTYGINRNDMPLVKLRSWMIPAEACREHSHSEL